MKITTMVGCMNRWDTKHRQKYILKGGKNLVYQRPFYCIDKGVHLTSRNGTVKKIGGQLMNIMSTNHASSVSRTEAVGNAAAKVTRKVVQA